MTAPDPSVAPGGTFTMAEDLTVTRMGFGAMQLAGPHVFGPPADRDAAAAVLREVVALGITHLDTSDFYGPHVTNQLIREALHPYPDPLRIVTKVGAYRDVHGGWPHARSPEQLRQAVHDNLIHLGLDVLDVVNLRVGAIDGPIAGFDRGAVRRAGGAGGRGPGPASRREQRLRRPGGRGAGHGAGRLRAEPLQPRPPGRRRPDRRARREGIAYVPYFPLGGFTPLQSHALDAVADRLGAPPMAVALAWLLRRSPNVLLIPGTSSVAHLRENVAAASLTLSRPRPDRTGCHRRPGHPGDSRP